MSEQLEIEINLDRRKHVKKKFLKPAKKAGLNLGNNQRQIQTVVGFWGENTREVFAYNAQVAVINSWAFIQLKQVTSMIVRPSLLFCQAKFSPEFVCGSGYKTPSIVSFFWKGLHQFSLTRPRGKKIYVQRHCLWRTYWLLSLSEEQILTYRTTTREGYRGIKSNPKICKTWPLLAVLYWSRQHQKIIITSYLEDALEVCEDIRHQRWDEGTVPTPERNDRTVIPDS